MSRVKDAYKTGYDSYKRLGAMEVVGIVEAAVESDEAKLGYLQGAYDAFAGNKFGTHLGCDERTTQMLVNKGIPVIANNKGSQYRMLQATQTERGKKIALDIVMTFVKE